MEKNKERKKRILDCALQQFLISHNINIRDIAKETNEHVPTIYKFFESKEVLVSQIVEIICNDIRSRLQKDLDIYKDSFLKITQFGVNYIKLSAENHELFKMLLNYNHEHIEEQQYSLLLQESLTILKSFVSDLYVTNRSSIPYSTNAPEDEHDSNIAILCSIAWSSVDGLANIFANKKRLSRVIDSLSFDKVVCEAFTYINIISQKFREENEDILFQALEIILQISKDDE